MSSHVLEIRKRTADERLRGDHIEMMYMLQEANDEIEKLHVEIKRLEALSEGRKVVEEEATEVCGHLTQIKTLQEDILSLQSELKTMKTATMLGEKTRKDMIKIQSTLHDDDRERATKLVNQYMMQTEDIHSLAMREIYNLQSNTCSHHPMECEACGRMKAENDLLTAKLLLSTELVVAAEHLKRESAKKESTYTRQIETMTAEAVQATAKISRYEVDIQDKAATIELLESLLHTAETKNNFLEGQIVKLESRKGQDVCTQTLNSGTEARPPATRGPCPVFVIDDNPLSSTFLTPSVEEDVETRHIHSSHADPPQKEVQGLGSSSFSSFPEYVALKRDQPDIVTCTKNGNGSGYRRKGLAAGAASKPPKRAPAR